MNKNNHKRRSGREPGKDQESLFDLLVSVGSGYLDQFVMLNRARIDDALRGHVVRTGEILASEIALSRDLQVAEADKLVEDALKDGAG